MKMIEYFKDAYNELIHKVSWPRASFGNSIVVMVHLWSLRRCFCDGFFQRWFRVSTLVLIIRFSSWVNPGKVVCFVRGGKEKKVKSIWTWNISTGYESVVSQSWFHEGVQIKRARRSVRTDFFGYIWLKQIDGWMVTTEEYSNVSGFWKKKPDWRSEA
jgi:hypothetical protein